jgi:hypothetical protein
MIVLYDPMTPRKSPRYDMTRKQLRELARMNGVKRGRNTADTVANLRKAGILGIASSLPVVKSTPLSVAIKGQ